MQRKYEEVEVGEAGIKGKRWKERDRRECEW